VRPSFIPEFCKEKKPAFSFKFERIAFTLIVQDTETRIEADNGVILPISWVALLGEFFLLSLGFFENAMSCGTTKNFVEHGRPFPNSVSAHEAVSEAVAVSFGIVANGREHSPADKFDQQFCKIHEVQKQGRI